MTPAEAEWVRANALTPVMRLLRSLCHCTDPAGLCTYCAGGPTDPRHGIGDGVEITPETWVYNRAGNPVSVGHRDPIVLVWLADRACRRICPCDCHSDAREPRPASQPVAVGAYELVPLFDLAAS